MNLLNSITFIIIFFISINSDAQVIVIKAKIIDFETGKSIPFCRIIVNDKMEVSSDTSGFIALNINSPKIEKIEFLSIGYYKLTLKIIKSIDTLRFDKIAMALIDVEDYYFVTIKENGKHDKKFDRKRKIEIKKEMKKQSSQAFVIYNEKKFKAINGFVKLK
jgi:hypothetical protein